MTPKATWAAVEAFVRGPKRIALASVDLVAHFEKRVEAMEGKVMPRTRLHAFVEKWAAADAAQRHSRGRSTASCWKKRSQQRPLAFEIVLRIGQELTAVLYRPQQEFHPRHFEPAAAKPE